ncbi:MAG: hypothetical protein KatS3mg062_1132 [Tepidiforma sp.]|nr:MAG: hypothetical protein KatS3mg062_1132 [Tepidiforma sp.]
MTSIAERPGIATYKQFIDGEWLDAVSGATFTRTSPYDGSVVGVYPNGGIEDAQRAILAARRAFDETSWPTSPAADRARILRKAADLLAERADAFATCIAAEVGKPKTMALAEVMATVDVFQLFAAKALNLKGESFTQQIPDAVGIVVHEPVGVVGIITPWNFPLLLISWKIGPAIAAGCTMVAKPSHYTPGSTLMLAGLLAEAGLPRGVFNVVTSETDNGALVGQHIAASELVDKVAFTGSTASGKAVMRAAANNVKKVSLELGGKSPNIVFPDAAVDAAVAGAFFGIYLNSGQVCQAGSRLLVSKPIKDEFVGEAHRPQPDPQARRPLRSRHHHGSRHQRKPARQDREATSNAASRRPSSSPAAPAPPNPASKRASSSNPPSSTKSPTRPPSPAKRSLAPSSPSFPSTTSTTSSAPPTTPCTASQPQSGPRTSTSP